MYTIEWKGNDHTNHESRQGVKPFVIVDHIAEAALGSVDNWFTDPGNNEASAHFCVGKNGEIHQYVKIEDYAWANGLPQDGWKDAPAQVVKDMNCNPNYYTVAIEHEGLDTDDMPDAQFWATCWLHRYIMQYVKDNFGVTMDLGKYNVIGHKQIDPVRKPCCPGDHFPWDKLYAELAIAEKMTMPDYELRVQYKNSPYHSLEYAVKTRLRIEDLYQKANGNSPYQEQALDKLCAVGKIMSDQGLMDG